jgi:hypothetical protein
MVKEHSMTESAAGPTGPGTVVLDLGADVGALILYAPAELDGAEIEISPDGKPGARRTHSRVRARPTAKATRYAAVYSGLAAGTYTVWRDHHTPAATVTVTGGQVSTCHWPG